MAEKVKISRDVAEAIERAIGFANENNIPEGTTKEYHIIDQIMESPLRNDDCVKGIRAFLHPGGYEIEQTPEEKLVERYDRLMSGKTIFEVEEGKNVAHGIKEALKILGIKIDGINGGEQNG